MERIEALTQAFVELADTLVSDFDAAEFLHMLARHCVDLLEVSAAGVMLADERGRLHVVAASDERTRLLELLELQHQEGPCVDAFARRDVVWTSVAAGRSQWPVFAEHASDAGYQSLGAVPMRLRDDSIGALNLFRVRDEPLDSTSVATAQALADVASIGLLQARSIRQSQLIASQLQAALDSRVAIEQAKGMVAQHLNVEVDIAFGLIRDHARSRNAKLTDVVRALTDRRLSIDELTVR